MQKNSKTTWATLRVGAGAKLAVEYGGMIAEAGADFVRVVLVGLELRLWVPGHTGRHTSGAWQAGSVFLLINYLLVLVRNMYFLAKAVNQLMIKHTLPYPSPIRGSTGYGQTLKATTSERPKTGAIFPNPPEHHPTMLNSRLRARSDPKSAQCCRVATWLNR